MEQYFVWYTLLLKAWMKRRASWLLTIGMCAMILIISQIHLPSADNTQIGICTSGDAYGQKILHILGEMDSVFGFQEYQNEDALLADVESGVLDCGFVFSKDFEKKVYEEQFEQSITYVCTPLTTKGAVAKETVYTAFLQLYGMFILEESELEIYKEKDADITRELLDRYQHYLENSRLLQMNTEMIDVEEEALHRNHSKESVYPIQGMVGVLLVLMLWIEGGRKFENNGTSVYAALDRKRSKIFEYCSYLASVTIPAAAALVMVVVCSEHRGVIREALLMLFLIAAASLWVLIVSRPLKKSSTFVAWILTIGVTQILICPVFVDLADFFPVISVIRWMFPVTWYLI